MDRKTISEIVRESVREAVASYVNEGKKDKDYKKESDNDEQEQEEGQEDQEQEEGQEEQESSEEK